MNNNKKLAKMAMSSIRGFHKHIRDNNGQCAPVITDMLHRKQDELYKLKISDSTLCIDPSYFS